VGQDQSLTALEREIEETRERLANTIDQLVYRAHPKVIAGRKVSDIKAHFVDAGTGRPRTDNILKVAGGLIGVVMFFAVVRKAIG
jgi:hypothetical protein